MKNIIICADGTWNKDEIAAEETGKLTSTNVAKLAASLAPEADGGVRQVLFYMEGVGAKDEEKITGGAFGFGVGRNILQAYRFLCRNYKIGDRIYLFGFSRGAYTVRSLAGLICNSGIVKEPERAHEAMRLYQEKSDPNKSSSIRSRLFRTQHSHDVTIHFLGVWDTVGAMGFKLLGHKIAKQLGWAWDYHATGFDKRVLHACHAVSIDERRSKFQPDLGNKVEGIHVTEKWFSGVHSDIGGGYVESGLSNITLKWMMTCAAERGLTFVADAERILGFSDENHPGNLKSGHLHRLDPRQFQRHDEWKGFFKWLDIMAGYKEGYERKYDQGNDEHESVPFVRELLQSYHALEPLRRWNDTGHHVEAGKDYEISIGADRLRPRKRSNFYGWLGKFLGRPPVTPEKWLCTVDRRKGDALALSGDEIIRFRPNTSGQLSFSLDKGRHSRRALEGYVVVHIRPAGTISRQDQLLS